MQHLGFFRGQAPGLHNGQADFYQGLEQANYPAQAARNKPGRFCRARDSI
tara:strand:- start:320 stop:469 length:150 start_codon:yes stop_codon:yes gene_type:complete